MDIRPAPVNGPTASIKLPGKRIGLVLIVALILLAIGIWAASLLRKQSAAGTDLPANLLAQALPASVDHTSGDQQLGQAGAGGLSDGQPEMELAESFFDFGTVSNSAAVSRDFFLWNRGDAPLIIRRAYTTCACTSAQISSVDIPPGMASRITIGFDPRVHDVTGMTVRRGLVLELNDPASPSVEIWIQASVRR